jgi:hypothetical protein
MRLNTTAIGPAQCGALSFQRLAMSCQLLLTGLILHLQEIVMSILYHLHIYIFANFSPFSIVNFQFSIISNSLKCFPFAKRCQLIVGYKLSHPFSICFGIFS